MTTPMTVEFRRETRPERSEEAVEWVEQGLALARGFEGYLGGGVLRDIDQRNVLKVVCYFCDEGTLLQWEHSPERRSWLLSGQALVVEERMQRRTGIEGWFDGRPTPRDADPVGTSTGSVRVVGVRNAPQRWKQACAIWLGMLPMNMLITWLVSLFPWWGDTPIVLRSLMIVSVLAPLMTFAVMPVVTKTLRPWLRRNPGLIRSERVLREALDSLHQDRQEAAR